MQQIIDFFDLDDEAVEAAARFLATTWKDDPNTVAGSGLPRWMAYRQEARRMLGVAAIFSKFQEAARFERVIINGHHHDEVEDIEIVDTPRQG